MPGEMRRPAHLEDAYLDAFAKDSRLARGAPEPRNGHRSGPVSGRDYTRAMHDEHPVEPESLDRDAEALLAREPVERSPIIEPEPVVDQESVEEKIEPVQTIELGSLLQELLEPDAAGDEDAPAPPAPVAETPSASDEDVSDALAGLAALTDELLSETAKPGAAGERTETPESASLRETLASPVSEEPGPQPVVEDPIAAVTERPQRIESPERKPNSRADRPDLIPAPEFRPVRAATPAQDPYRDFEFPEPRRTAAPSKRDTPARSDKTPPARPGRVEPGPSPETPQSEPAIAAEASPEPRVRATHFTRSYRVGSRNVNRDFVIRIAGVSALLIIGSIVTWRLAGTDQESQDVFALAENLIDRKQFRDASALLQDFAREEQKHALRSEAAYLSAFALHLVPETDPAAGAAYRDAIGLFHTFLERYPEHPKVPRAETLLGIVYYKTGQYGQAKSILGDSTRKDRDPSAHLAALRYLGRASAATDDLAGAHDAFVRAATHERNDKPYEDRLELATIYEQLAQNSVSSPDKQRYWELSLEQIEAALQTPDLPPTHQRDLTDRRLEMLALLARSNAAVASPSMSGNSGQDVRQLAGQALGRLRSHAAD